MTKLRVLCPQEYDSCDMRVAICTRCSQGWSATEQRCEVVTGAEHLPLVAAEDVPACPIADRCQHQRQQAEPCVVRARGLVCESALSFVGLDGANHPLGFNAQVVATPEEVTAWRGVT